MPINFVKFDDASFIHGAELLITDEALLARYVGDLILGHHVHIKRILKSRSRSFGEPINPNEAIEAAINKIKMASSIEKRDGWIFQMISWISVNIQCNGQKVFSQPPHDAPAQHGLDGLTILLDCENKIDKIIITEDKATKHPRKIIHSEIWPEFEKFEKGEHDNKLVCRISAMLDDRIEDDVFDSIMKDIYRIDIRRYRIGVTHKSEYQDVEGRKKLFKGYDECIKGEDSSRRSADTFIKENIREWMESFSCLIVNYLESKKYPAVCTIP